MSKPKFTPGPWSPGHMTRADVSCNCRYILCEGYFGSIATVSQNNGLRVGDGGNDSPPEEEAIANAHLIAAAPALFEALWQLLDDMGEDGLCVCQAAKDQALKALKAACPDDRGEEAAKTSADDAQ